MSTEWLVTNLLSVWLMPPLNLIALIALGLFIAPRRRRLGLAIAGSALSILAVLSTVAVGSFLVSTLERDMTPISAAQLRDGGAGAIVILGGGRNRGSPEYGGETISSATLARVRYGARLARETRLPVLVSGGKPDGGKASEADLMAAALADDFGLSARWREGSSINTIENARFSARMLEDAGIKRVILVTDAWHMRRSVERFRSAGLEVIPAPTNYATQLGLSPVDFLPTTSGLFNSNRAFHEWIGILVSRARGV